MSREIKYAAAVQLWNMQAQLVAMATILCDFYQMGLVPDAKFHTILLQALINYC
jgi:hypothetical protein